MKKSTTLITSLITIIATSAFASCDDPGYEARLKVVAHNYCSLPVQINLTSRDSHYQLNIPKAKGNNIPEEDTLQCIYDGANASPDWKITAQRKDGDNLTGDVYSAVVFNGKGHGAEYKGEYGVLRPMSATNDSMHNLTISASQHNPGEGGGTDTFQTREVKPNTTRTIGYQMTKVSLSEQTVHLYFCGGSK